VAKHYDWIPGEPPPRLGRHSIAKHTVLGNYLEKYVAILAARPVQERLRLTLVDGFAGGGLYRHPDTGEPTYGSPLIMLNAMYAAEAAANQSRRKKFHLDVEYFFIEKSQSTVAYLRQAIADSEIAHNYREQLQVLHGTFIEHLDAVLARIEQRGRSRRVIFLLDQYGFSSVRMADLRRIFRRLPNAEVILTFATDWLIDHWTDSPQYTEICDDLGIDIPASAIALIKQDQPLDWRAVIQHTLHRAMFRNSGADFYTPFFIFSADAHRAYWLLHFSGHSKARDVMVQLHWEMENHFQHFGGPGFCMLGYDPRKDLARFGRQMLPFGFDSFAAEETRLALLDQLPRRLNTLGDGVRFGAFFDSVVNETPATKQMIANGVRDLTIEKELEVRTSDGRKRRDGVIVQDDDIVLRPKQRLLLPRT
jgi:three-Cys-motif partner protein